MKQKFFRIFFFLFLFCFMSCSRQENAKVEEAFSDENISLSKWEKISVDNQDMLAPVLIGDVLYYWNGDWDRDDKRWGNSSIYRKRGEEEKAEEIAALGEKQLIYFLVDEEYNLYYLYGEFTPDGKEFFFRKESGEGIMIYDVPVSAQEEEMQMIDKLGDISQGGYVTQGVVSSQGESVLCNSYGELYLFDGNGQFLCAGNAGWDMEAHPGAAWGLVNVGDEGIYSYVAAESKVLLQRINMADGSLGKIIEVPVESEVSLNIYSGYDSGILIADSSILWEYRLSEKEMTKILDWGDATVNLNLYEISAIGMGEGCLYALVRRPNNPNSQEAVVRIAFPDESEILEKQVVILGITYDSDDSFSLKNMAKEFNKYNSEYQIEIKTYSSTEDLYKDLLRGSGADAFELGITDKYILAEKGILENLSPYFATSEVVKESDILPAIRNAGYVGDKYVFLFPGFSVSGYLVEQGTTDNGGWTPEEFIALGEKYPASLLRYDVAPSSILLNILSTNMESFINWQDMECYFDSDRFVFLLEGILRVSDKGKNIDLQEYFTNALQLLHDKEILTDMFRISSVEEYLDYRGGYEYFAEFAGHPNQSGKLYYRMEPTDILSMNSASKVKEGVWAFMEFLLSEENQSQAPHLIPVHKEAFEEWIAAEELERLAGYNNSESWQQGKIVYQGKFTMSDKFPEVTDADREFLRYMVDNLYWDDSLYGKDISKIIFEEAGAFFAGDKTAKEAAEIIQNRVSLLINE